MRIKAEWSNGGASTIVNNTSENEVMKVIGKMLIDAPVPSSVNIITDKGRAHYHVGQRGQFVKNGIVYPSIYITEDYNSIDMTRDEDYPETYLTCINPESNNYKFYHMKPHGDLLDITYGRIGSERGDLFGVKDINEPYDSRLYWIRYYEKLSKGYTDQSAIFLGKNSVSSEPTVKVKKNASTDLYFSFLRFCKAHIEECLTNTVITEKQVKESKKVFKELSKRTTVKGFNNQLQKLLVLNPRKITGDKLNGVDSFLAHSKADFAHIIAREENLLNSMEAVTSFNSDSRIKSGDYFKDHGINVFLASDEQKSQVLSKLDDALKSKVKNIYRVINKSHVERFNQYLKKNRIKYVRQFWHGSRNENWLSITENGLLLNPNAIITGKMFGNGIYFAPSSNKSWNYTSFRNTYWAKGSSNTAFMGLYATAYGKPLDVDSSYHYTEGIVTSKGYNCVHAHAGTQLKNDEIIFYNESAILLQYIVEFEE